MNQMCGLVWVTWVSLDSQVKNRSKHSYSISECTCLEISFQKNAAFEQNNEHFIDGPIYKRNVLSMDKML